MGIRQVDEGNFEDAVFTLDTAVRKLEDEPERRQALVQAYVYLGTAYVGLDHEDAARGKFRQALRLDPDVRLDASRFPPRVLKVFDEQVLEVTVSERKRSARRFLIIGALGAGAAVGVAAATRGTTLPENREPSASINFTPARAIVGVTTVTFTASADDPDGDPLTYSWDFGDGTTATGSTVTHRFGSEASHVVTLTVSDGRGASVTAERSYVARTLTGEWRKYETPPLHTLYHCEQNGALLECHATTPNPWTVSIRGMLTDPFAVDAEIINNDGYHARCVGEVWDNLNCLDCVEPSAFLQQFDRAGADPYGDLAGCQR